MFNLHCKHIHAQKALYLSSQISFPELLREVAKLVGSIDNPPPNSIHSNFFFISNTLIESHPFHEHSVAKY